MKLRIQKAPWTVMLVGALFALLALLAVLQYRWLGEVSQGERERMQANLKVAASHFTEDIDRELTRAYLTFQMDTALSPDQTGQYYAGCMARWAVAAAYPRIVRSLFLAETTDGRQVTLTRFNSTSGKFEKTDWPPELDRLRRSFGQQSQPGVSGLARIIHISSSPIDDEIPALMIPLVTLPAMRGDPNAKGLGNLGNLGNLGHLSQSMIATKTVESLSLAFSFRKKHNGFTAPLPLGFAIVVLDLDYISQELIPELANRYFSSGGALDYNLAIVSRRDAARVIYKSEPASDPLIHSPDATEELFALRLDKIGSLLPDSLLAERGVDGTHTGRLAYRVFSLQQGEKGAVNPLASESEGRWQLLLKHRAGSLETVVASSRRRNLIASSGILVLLAVSLTIIMLSVQRAQRLARQQMEFVAGVSHELRTPLAVICSAGENLADGVIDDRQQIRRYGEVIRNEGRRLTEMVEQVLEFAGIQSGRRAYNISSVDVASVIDRALLALEPALANDHFQIEKKIASYLPPVMADSSALSRAIQNLVDNAMKYSGDSRWIGVSARTEVLDGKFEVQIGVSDKGMGIAPADLPRVFEPFHRGQATVAAQIHGNGLGLSLVKHILEAHGGRVDVRSVEGEGSSFTLHLPAAVQTEEVHVAVREVRSDA
jgi:two-component system sensor histidine kinase SenX3